MGDILLAEPLPRLLKEAAPRRRLLFVTKEAYASIPGGWPAVDEVLHLPEGGGLTELRSIRRRLVELHPACLLDLHNNPRSRLLSMGLPVRRLPKFRTQKLLRVHARRLASRLKLDAPPVYRRYLNLAGFEPGMQDDPPRLVVDGRRLFREGAAWELLVPAAGLGTKAWPEDYWIQFVERLLDRSSLPLRIAGGTAEERLGRRMAALAPERIESCCGSLDLAGSAGLVAGARRVICCDTGLMHMAAAAGIPGLALFGSTTRELGFFPAGDTIQVLERKLECRPCGHIGRRRCPLGHFRCMRELAPDEVLARYLEL